MLWFERPGGWHSVTNFGDAPVELPDGEVLVTSVPLVDGLLPGAATAGSAASTVETGGCRGQAVARGIRLARGIRSPRPADIRSGPGTAASIDSGAWQIRRSTSSARSTSRRPTTPSTRPRKEVAQRYDFKGVGASIEWSGEKVLIKANTEERVKAVLDVFQPKLIKRGISLKSLDAGRARRRRGKEYRIEVAIKDGISQENAKKIAKIIRDEGPKSVKSQIQGDELRVPVEEPRRPAGRPGAAQGRRPRGRPAVRELPLTGGHVSERMPAADAAAGPGDERMPQPGVDVPDRRGRTGLDLVGRDLDRQPARAGARSAVLTSTGT